MANIQYGNVGNLGDILKHGPLVALAAHLGARSLTYVDTHTFLLSAPCPNAARWRLEAAMEMREHPGYAEYMRLEDASLTRTGEYRCSMGLVLDATGGRATLVASEADHPTRAKLTAQLTEAGVTPARLSATRPTFRT